MQTLVRLQRTAHNCAKIDITRPISRLIELLIRLVWSAHIKPGAKIAPTVRFAHSGLGCIVNALCEIGPGCIVGPHVVMGGKAPQIGAPMLDQNVIVHAGAKLVGAIHVGEGCVIGANAVVITDLPAFSLAVGVPARIVKENINPSNYR